MIAKVCTAPVSGDTKHATTTTNGPSKKKHLYVMSVACPFNTFANLGELVGSTTCNNCSANYDTAGTTGNTACARAFRDSASR